MPSTLSWLRDAAAQQADLRVNGDGGGGGDGLAIADTGSFTIPAGMFVASKDQTRPATVELTRSNQITPAGAAVGSSMTVGVENDIDVIVMACPTCP
jgi:hypothetical protein